MLIRLAVSMIFFVLIAVNVHGQSLWRGAEYGMSPEEVLHIFPQAIKTPKRASASTSDGQIIIQKVQIDYTDFEAHFHFGTSGLMLVSLKCKRPDKYTFAKFEELLRLKYGNPIKLSDTPEHIGLHMREWLSSAVTIKILFLNQVDDRRLSIVYSVEKQQAIDSL